jgi:hypothetical protein
VADTITKKDNSSSPTDRLDNSPYFNDIDLMDEFFLEKPYLEISKKEIA